MSSIAVFAPSPVLTVTVERGSGSDPEIHLHAGGQGFWVARMAAALGAEVTICVPLGGETGTVLESLLRNVGLIVRSVGSMEPNGCYIHDRRTGSRAEVASTRSGRLERHEVDELFGAALTAGLAADVTLLTGPRHDDVLSAATYARLARDLRANGRTVLADLTGGALASALEGGIDLLKLSSEELVGEGLAQDGGLRAVVPALRELREKGARDVLVSRGPEPAVALAGERLLEISGPRFSPFDPRGSGDSMFSALGVGLAEGQAVEGSLRLAAAAGALNVTRHGLGSGHREDIDRLAGHVEVAQLDSDPADTGIHAAH